MRTRIYVISLMALTLAIASGCSKKSTAVESADGAASQSSVAQATGDSNGQDNLPPQSSRAVQQHAAPSSAIVIPAGTAITVRLQQPLSSATAVRGQRFEAVLEQPVVSGDRVVVPSGTPVEGHVVSARHSGRLHHPGQLSLTLDNFIVDGRYVPVGTSHVVAQGGSHKKRNWGWIGGGAGGGALIGALAGGGKGALIGSGIGAAAGTTTAYVTGKKDVTFGSERVLRFRLDQDVNLS